LRAKPPWSAPTATVNDFWAAAPTEMRTPRVAAISRAHGATIAPGDASPPPPGGAWSTSSAVTMSFTRGAMVARATVRHAQDGDALPRRRRRPREPQLDARRDTRPPPRCPRAPRGPGSRGPPRPPRAGHSGQPAGLEQRPQALGVHG